MDHPYKSLNPVGAAWWTAAVVTMLAAIVPAVLWVGDIGWIQDEPRLIPKAYHANARHGIETHGLNGNFGVPYGPLPTQIYQVMLLITHDPVTLAGIRSGLCAGVTAFGLLWLGRSLRLNPWFATAIVLAPYVWNFHRFLWDASFAIPLGTLALAAYASFLVTRSRRSLFTTIASTIAIVFIHPQDLPVALPIAGHLLWRHRPSMARHYIGIALILGITFALNASYFRKAYDAVAWRLTQEKKEISYPGARFTRAESLFVPLLGGSILGGSRFALNDSQLRVDPALLRIVRIGSSIAYPLIWLGIVSAVVWVLKRNVPPRADGPGPGSYFVRPVIFGIALTGLVLQMLLYGVLRMPGEPQYFFGTFVLHVLFAWIAVDTLARIRLQWLAIGVYGSSVAFITIASLVKIHQHGYDRNVLPRPSLANQAQVARELNAYSDQTVLTDVLIYKSHPQAIRSLRLLLPPAANQSQTESGRLMIRYRSGPTGTDSAIELVELPEGQIIPKDFEPLDVTPLPPEWQPAKW
jgi:hypothetical protein